jgi:hypothetical protein
LRKLSRTIYIHDEVCEQLARDRQDISPRFSMLCRRLGVDEWVRFKSTKGENTGWRRSPLGGTGGSHFYMWWIPAGSTPGKRLNLQTGEIAIRSIRHHDLTDKRLSMGNLEDYWEFKFAEELDDEQLLDQPWTEDQQSFIEQRESCQILIGPPGSGKTLSLWRAVEVALLEDIASESEREHNTLYITWSQRLAESADKYFTTMAPQSVKVYDLNHLFAHCLSHDIERIGLAESRRRFIEHLDQLNSHYELKKRVLSRPDYYFDLIRAWIIGRADWEYKRVGNSKQNDEQEDLIQNELKDAHTLYQALQFTHDQMAYIFPELYAAHQVCQTTLKSSSQSYQQFVIDEVQDLTPLEIEATLKILQHWSMANPQILIAGDEAQVVRPTYFEFAELNDQLYTKNYHPKTSTLSSNLRSPKVIADCVSRAKRFNRLLTHKYRPADQVNRTASFEAEALLALTVYDERSQVTELLYTLSQNPNIAFIYLYKNLDQLRDNLGMLGDIELQFNTPEAVKGLEFTSVCLLGTASLIEGLTDTQAQQDPLAFRLSVNRLRVAMSRAIEHLIFVEARNDVNIDLREIIGGDALRSDWESYLSPLDLEHKQEGMVVSLETVIEELAPSNQSADERVQGFIDRAERLFFDDQKVQEALKDLINARHIALHNDDLSEDIWQTLTRLTARIIVSEALKPTNSRQLDDVVIQSSEITEILQKEGGQVLLHFTHRILLWSSQPEIPIEDLRAIFYALSDTVFRSLTWITRVLNDRKRDLFALCLAVAAHAQDDLGDLEETLLFLGFEADELDPLALQMRRAAFDHLIYLHWEIAAQIWSTVFSQEKEDLIRSAQLCEVKSEWLDAAQLYEQVDLSDRAFKNYRLAGCYDHATRLVEGRSLEELESWDIIGLDLVSVFTKYVERHPLSPAERTELLSHGNDQIKTLKTELSDLKLGLIDQNNLMEERLDKVNQHLIILAKREDQIRQAELNIEVRDASSKRKARLVHKEQSQVVSESLTKSDDTVGQSSDTVMMAPVFDFSIHEQEMSHREARIQHQAQNVAQRESELTQWGLQADERYQRLNTQEKSMTRKAEQLNEREQHISQQTQWLIQQEQRLAQRTQQLELQEQSMREQQAHLKQKDLQTSQQHLTLLQLQDTLEQQSIAMTVKETELNSYEEELNRHAGWSERRAKELEEQSSELRWLSLELERWYDEYHQRVNELNNHISPPDILVDKVRHQSQVQSNPRADRHTMLTPKINIQEAFKANYEDTSSTQVNLPVFSIPSDIHHGVSHEVSQEVLLDPMNKAEYTEIQVPALDPSQYAHLFNHKKHAQDTESQTVFEKKIQPKNDEDSSE